MSDKSTEDECRQINLGGPVVLPYDARATHGNVVRIYEREGVQVALVMCSAMEVPLADLRAEAAAAVQGVKVGQLDLLGGVDE